MGLCRVIPLSAKPELAMGVAERERNISETDGVAPVTPESVIFAEPLPGVGLFVFHKFDDSVRTDICAGRFLASTFSDTGRSRSWPIPSVFGRRSVGGDRRSDSRRSCCRTRAVLIIARHNGCR